MLNSVILLNVVFFGKFSETAWRPWKSCQTTHMICTKFLGFS